MDDLVERMVAAIKPEQSPSFRQGKIGSWRDEFDDEIKAEFKKRAGTLVTLFGSEKDDSW